MCQIRVAVILVLVAFAASAYSKPSSMVPMESQGAPTDEETMANALDYAIKTAAERDDIPAEARGRWSRFRDRYLRPAIPSIVGSLISRG